MERKKVVILSGDDWEGIYIDGKLYDEGHNLGEGNSFTYLLELAEEYNFKRSDVIIDSLYSDDIDNLEKQGNLPILLTDLIHDYGLV